MRSNSEFEVAMNVTKLDNALYEVFTFSDGSSEIWKTQPNMHPLQALTDRWLSDFGLGDYDWVVRNAVNVKRYTGDRELPSDIRARLVGANETEKAYIEWRKSLKPIKEANIKYGVLIRFLERLTNWLKNIQK